MSLGGIERKGNLATFKVDLPTDIDGIVDKLREILLKGEVQAITVRTGEPIVFQRFVTDGGELLPGDVEETFVDLTLAEIIRNIPMEEFSLQEQGLEGTSPQSLFFWMLLYTEMEGWVPTHMLVSESTEFWSWIGLSKRRGRKLEKFLGLHVERDKNFPDHAFLICGARHKGASITEIGFLLKGSTNGETVRENDRSRTNPPASSTATQDVAKPAG